MRTLGGGDIGVRTASAVVLAPAAVAAAWLGDIWFFAVMAAAVILLAVEWALMSAPAQYRQVAWAVGAALVATIMVVQFGRLSSALVTMVVAAGAAALFARRQGQSGTDASYGVLYIGWPALLIIWMRDMPDGLGWTVMLFAVAWSADIMAFVTGSLLKGPKLWPRFSPNKTWAGFVGGLAAGTAAGMLAALWLDLGPLTPVWGATVGFLAALATMGGDLWESALKRRFGVKDSGAIIPGHGGLLDRVDGLMFAIVVLAGARAVLFYSGMG